MLQITEDTPPDMLAGAMDLTVHLPTGGTVKMSVERSTPMMDLLVQVTTNQHLQLSGYTLQALSMAPSHDHADRILPFKPNTPIGALDTQHIKVIPKSRTIPVPKNIPTGHQPFESTFRLKVHLPRNQLFVTRVSQSVHLEEIMKKVCQEKNLEPVKYEFRHPGNLDEILDPKLSLSDYQITEIYLVTKGTGSLNQAFSSSDIMALRKEEERKQMHNKTGGGVFNLIFRRGNKSSSGSLSSDNRSISPTQSDDSRSVTPPAVPQQIITPPQPDPPVDKPKPPQRKRRPAPKPPQRKDCTDKPPSNISDLQPEGIETGLTLCHSRNSSDSSGYHEASVLSENCNTSLPRRPKSTIIPDNANKLSEMHSQSTSNLTKMSTHSKSTSSLAVPGRKKKSAPPPPPALASASSVTNLQTPSPVVASQPSIIAQPSDSLLSTRTPLDSLASIQSTPTVEEVKPVDIPSPQIETEKVPTRAPEIKAEETDELDSDWQYQLPSPPKAFRDSSPVTFTEVTNKDEIADSVVTSPELFEKLKVIKKESETVSEVTSVVSEEEKPIFSKLSLENLEKRKSLVYNRELSTSLKASEEETFSSSLTKFEKTYEEVRRSSPVKEVVMTRSTLPNFKITTYDNPKQKLNIFEDDTIRSNTTDGRRDSAESNLRRTSIGRSMDNISFGRKGSTGNTSDDDFKKPDYKFYKPQSKTQINVFRSESFSKEQEWSPSKPVTRSKSQVALNRYKTNASNVEEEDNLNKTGSLFDVSGLQSLGVMRLIQTKLNTPTNSMDNLNTLGKPTQEPEVQRPEPQPEHRPEPRKAYRVPSINMGTWSERPKIPVNVKEDPDYKFGVKDNNSSKLIVNTTNNNMKSYNSIEVKKLGNNFSSFKAPESKNVSIKVNGSESISTQTGGNVVIKIGESKPVTFRKPLGNINKIGNGNPRPHSIAFGSDFDISRVPVVRSVEFKKPYKDYQNNNTTVTHIYPSNNFKSHTLNKTTSFNNPQPLGNGTEKYQSSESLLKPQPEPKPVFRVNSYLPKSSTPVVRGFQANRMSWNQPQSISTLPSKNDNKVFSTNKSVPFSQTNLKRAESAKVPVTPPPPPVLPKLNHVNTIQPVESNNSDPKEQLLQAIRDFGGKRGLRGVRA